MKTMQLLQRKAFRFRRFENKAYSAFNSMHKTISIGVLSVASLTFAVSGEVRAQQTDSTQIMLQKNLDEVQITDNAATLINQVGKITTVITRQDIDNLKVESVSELLSAIASVDIQTRGAHGVQSDVSIRGGNFDQTAILLNGINITNPHTGHYSMDIPVALSDIERIEIIKGPSAIIYGASAFSGGINIITRKNVRQALDVTLEAGEHGFLNGEVSLAKKIKNVENYLSLGYKNSDGYIDNSDYGILNLMYQNRVNLKNNNLLDFQIGYNKKDYGANTFYSAKYNNQYEKTDALISSIKGVFNLSDNLTVVPSAYYNLHTDEFYLIRDVSKPNQHKNNVLGNNISLQYTYRNFSLNFGTDTRYEEILSSVLGVPMSLHSDKYDRHQDRINFSYFVQGNLHFKKFLVTLGLMSFQNTMIAQDIMNVYPSVNMSYRISGSWDAYLAFNTSSRLPSFTELYYKDAVHEANPELRQEKSVSYEGGIKYRNRFFLFDASAYYMQGKDMIDWMKENAADEKWMCMNINKLNKYGIDLTGKFYLSEMMPFLLDNTTFTLSYSYMNQEQGDIDYISSYVLNYLKHKLNLKLSLPFAKHFALNVSGRYCQREGSFTEYVDLQPARQKDYDPFFTMDVNLEYNIKMFRFYISATNILDKDYYDIGNIPQPGRWVIGGMKFHM